MLEVTFIPNKLHLMGLVHWEDPEGSGREGGGRGDREYM